MAGQLIANRWMGIPVVGRIISISLQEDAAAANLRPSHYCKPCTSRLHTISVSFQRVAKALLTIYTSELQTALESIA